jgi:hypothetical protein
MPKNKMVKKIIMNIVAFSMRVIFVPGYSLSLRQNPVVAAASLSHKKQLLLSLRFRTKNNCCCRFAFAQKTIVAAASLSHKKQLLPLRFRTKI